MAEFAAGKKWLYLTEGIHHAINIVAAWPKQYTLWFNRIVVYVLKEAMSVWHLMNGLK